MGILSYIWLIVSSSGSLHCCQCLHSTADWILIQIPKSRSLASGELAGCGIISVLNSSNNALLYSYLALVPCPLALSITRQTLSLGVGSDWGFFKFHWQSGAVFVAWPSCCSSPLSWWWFLGDSSRKGQYCWWQVPFLLIMFIPFSLELPHLLTIL
jgi:hypothetical protein